MTVVGAQYEVTDGDAMRTVPAGEFHVSYYTTSLGDGELLEAVSVPKLGPGWGWGFEEVSRRPGDFALVAAGALVRSDGGEIVEARIAVAGVGDRPLRATATEMAVAGATPADLDARVEAIAGIEPTDDAGASADYRRRLARVLVIRALAAAAARSGAAA